MSFLFAPNDPSIPPRLRSRIESWSYRKPKTQFQQYGPLNAYLSIKFPPDAFLVKPQALLRELWDMRNLEDADAVALRATILGLADHTMDVDDGAQRASIDSQGVFHSNSITSQTVYHFVVNL